MATTAVEQNAAGNNAQDREFIHISNELCFTMTWPLHAQKCLNRSQSIVYSLEHIAPSVFHTNVGRLSFSILFF